MSTSLPLSHSRSCDSLSALAKSDKPLTICDVNDLVMPILLNVLEVVPRGSSCSQVVLGQLKNFRVGLEYIKEYFDKLKVLECDAGNSIKMLLRHIVDAHFTVAAFTNESTYGQLNATLTRLKIFVPPHYCRLPPGLVGHELRAHEANDLPGKLTIYPCGINPAFESPSAFGYFSESYKLLDPLHKTCLLCFSAFPEDAEINKRTIIFWWIGEELINPNAGNYGEETGHEILGSLIEHGFVEDVIKKDRVSSSCRVRPFIRNVLIYLAKAAKFFDYLEDREHVADSLRYGTKCRVCLVKAHNVSSTTSSFSSLQHLRGSPDTYLACIETVFNVNKCYLDIKLHWFWKMKHIKALYMGRCDSKAIQHIEVKSTKFLSGLSYMRRLRLLSLRGISKIVKLPDSVGMAKNLRILDLRDCNDMEELPDTVKSLEKLTHLDLSGCYSLARLPKGVASLLELQVLKGFLIREHHQKTKDSCDFEDLTKLKKLRKLSIIASFWSFPMKEHLEIFKEMVELRKLTIVWRGIYGAETAEQIMSPEAVLVQLEKLDLQHIPYKTAPPWLVSDKLQNLKKLYIKGGKFLGDLGTKRYPPWKVETLRLKYLPQLWMSCTEELQNFFPNLTYLELVKCPKLSVPCNDEGVWRKLL